VAGVPRPSSISTGCTDVLVVSHSCSPVVSIVSLARRLVRTDTPPWQVVRHHGRLGGATVQLLSPLRVPFVLLDACRLVSLAGPLLIWPE
jgi:hypothetical protein